MTVEATAEKDDDLFILSTPDRTVSFLPDIASIAVHTKTLIEGMHPFTEDCTLTGDTRYCAGYTIAGSRLAERWTESGLNDEVVWAELRRWMDSDGPLRQELADQEAARREIAKVHWR